ncbi:hypothetical protein [Brytella acorum]|uniref:Uncharacterized protein n=1 Tax=Brytella acorum TaxID=2959299 RepID=A0AA35XWR0_9PROT|nr:hypothetical protein [Brytella acorum]MDF3625641.1 hypothetical protein [Brytella acorum]CAI9119506.1 hypothetical protein LMG32879_000321 [Brytella acorum]
MFVIESWPAGEIGPHLTASADTRIVSDILMPFVDAVIWARRVPRDWDARLGATGGDLTRSAILSGPFDHVLKQVEGLALGGNRTPFLKDDVEQIISLTAALGMSHEVRLQWLHVEDRFAPGPLDHGRLRALCVYGTGSIAWSCQNDASGMEPVALDPYGILFTKPLMSLAPSAAFQASGPACYALCVDVA